MLKKSYHRLILREGGGGVCRSLTRNNSKIVISSFRDLRGFRQKISTKHWVLIRFRSNADLHTFQKILRKTNSQKKYCWTFFPTIFLAIFLFIFLESSETYADLSLNKIGAKLIFLSKFSVEKHLFRNLKLNFVKQKKISIYK